MTNWSLLSYTGAIYNIIETVNDTWNVHVSLFLTERGDSNEFAVLLPLNLAFEDYESAFKYIQRTGPVFINTLQDVIVIDKQGKKVKIYNIDKIVPSTINTPKSNKTKYQHAGNHTIN